MGDTKKNNVKKSTNTSTSKNTKTNTKESTKDKKIIPIIVIGVVLLLVIIVIICIINGNDKKKPVDDNGNGKEPDKKEELPKVTEEDLVKAYGFSSKDAIALVKTDFHSDNFTFTAEVTQDYLYIVTAKDKLSSTEYKIEVNPVLKTFVYLN